MIQVNITSWEYSDAMREASRRLANYAKLGIEHEFLQGNLYDRNIIGVCGELAVGKWLGLLPKFVGEWQPGVADLGEDIEVRTASRYRDPLYLFLRGNADPNRRYVLVVKTPNKGYHYDIVGWTYGSDVFANGKYYPPDKMNNGRHGVYVLDSRMLLDPEELKASVLWPLT